MILLSTLLLSLLILLILVPPPKPTPYPLLSNYSLTPRYLFTALKSQNKLDTQLKADFYLQLQLWNVKRNSIFCCTGLQIWHCLKSILRRFDFYVKTNISLREVAYLPCTQIKNNVRKRKMNKDIKIDFLYLGFKGQKIFPARLAYS